MTEEEIRELERLLPSAGLMGDPPDYEGCVIRKRHLKSLLSSAKRERELEEALRRLFDVVWPNYKEGKEIFMPSLAKKIHALLAEKVGEESGPKGRGEHRMANDKVNKRLQPHNPRWQDCDYELKGELVHCDEGYIAEVLSPISPEFTAELVERANAARRFWKALEAARRMVEDSTAINPDYEIERVETLHAIDEALSPYWQSPDCPCPAPFKEVAYCPDCPYRKALEAELSKEQK